MILAADLSTSPIRPVDLSRDLPAIADLIEVCFRETMDADGQEYLRYVRRMAQYNFGLPWETVDQRAIPLGGLVWVEDERIIGNLTLIPLNKGGRKVYLIANVAVHPNYRRRGIARQLTQRALELAEERRAESAWLQVRDDNPAAHQLYLGLGFNERNRRTTWLLPPERTVLRGLIGGLELRRRAFADWPQQQTWLEKAYPPDVIWNLPLRIERFKPGLFNWLNQFLNSESIRHWAAVANNRQVGMLTWEQTHLANDNLWLAVDPAWESAAIRTLLPAAAGQHFRHRSLSLNYPAGRAEEDFLACNFLRHSTLIWMEVVFKPLP